MSYILQALDKSAAARDSANNTHDPSALAPTLDPRKPHRLYYAGLMVLLLIVLLLGFKLLQPQPESVSEQPWLVPPKAAIQNVTTDFSLQSSPASSNSQLSKKSDAISEVAPQQKAMPPGIDMGNSSTVQAQSSTQTHTKAPLSLPTTASQTPTAPPQPTPKDHPATHPTSIQASSSQPTTAVSPPVSPDSLPPTASANSEPITRWQTTRVIGIHSGCEIEIDQGHTSRRVVLAGVRCSTEAPYDKLARRFVTRMIFTHTVDISESLSSNNQVLVRLADKQLLNRLLVIRGLGWASSPHFATDERIAKQGRRGIWLAAHP